jgi:hypothetical protein
MMTGPKSDPVESYTGTQTSTSPFSSLEQTIDNKRQHYNVSAVQIGNTVRDGDEFVMITRNKQSEGFQVWSSGDQQQTEQLYKQAARQIAGLEQTSTT